MAGTKKIAILGLRGSGKSTFLAVLNRALALRNSSWRIRPVGPTIKMMSNLMDLIFSKGLFPPATMEEDEMKFYVEKEASMLGLQPGAEFVFSITDVPGEATMGTGGSVEYHDFYQRYVHDCAGIIFLLDPEEAWRSKNDDDTLDVYYPLFSSILAEIKNQVQEDVFIAFCVTKLDMVLPANSAFASHGVLKDIEIFAEKILGKATKSLIDHYFDPDHIAWFPISSIGYVGEGNQRSTQYIVRESEGFPRSGIRNLGLLKPIGIAEAFEWLLNSIADYEEDLIVEKVRGRVYSKLLRKLFGR